MLCTPHTCRRYNITRALQSDTRPADVARQCGVSIEVIMRHYYAATKDEFLQQVRQVTPLDRLVREQWMRRTPNGGAQTQRLTLV